MGPCAGGAVYSPAITDFVFFFHAEDGIRDGRVTGVQTCALPIFWGIASTEDPDQAMPQIIETICTGFGWECEIGRASCRERVLSWGAAAVWSRIPWRLRRHLTPERLLIGGGAARLRAHGPLRGRRRVLARDHGLRLFFSRRRRHTRWTGDWSSDVCSSDLLGHRLHRGPRPGDAPDHRNNLHMFRLGM